ncbi:MAG: RNA-binding S4 domain-containing protein [Lachnospiraceae bacterium]|jgi:ribosome-associated protein|nr:RNA-binding S4 domain-containing protein [Lachnospiraceae bacterium]
MNYINLKDEYIKLGQALKVIGVAESGAEAKIIINEGYVKVNNEEELRRGRKLYDGDVILVEGMLAKVIKNDN